MGQLVDTSGARDQQIDVETDSDEAANDNLIGIMLLILHFAWNLLVWTMFQLFCPNFVGPDKNGDKSSFNKENRNLNGMFYTILLSQYYLQILVTFIPGS